MGKNPTNEIEEPYLPGMSRGKIPSEIRYVEFLHLDSFRVTNY